MTLLLALTLSAPAAEVVLQNDDLDVKSATVPRSLAIDESECLGATFYPDADHYPFEILYIDTIMLATDNLEVGIWEVDPSGFPVARIDSEAAYFTASTTSWNRVTVSELKLDPAATYFTEGEFLVSICPIEGTGWQLSEVLIPDDYLDYPDRNYLQTGQLGGVSQWYDMGYINELLGPSGNLGDWVIRVVIETGDDTGGGAGGGTDTGTAGGGTDDGTGGGADTGADTGAAVLSLSSITPDSAVEGEAVDVVLLGSGFGTGAEARVGGIPITGQEILSPETITGRLPTTLPVGVHDVEVVMDGESALLPGGFSVTEAEVLAEEKGSCGCSARPSGPGGLAWLLGLLALAGLRRR